MRYSDISDSMISDMVICQHVNIPNPRYSEIQYADSLKIRSSDIHIIKPVLE